MFPYLQSSHRLRVVNEFVHSNYSKKRRFLVKIQKTVSYILLYAKGYTGSKSNAFDYLVKIEQREGKAFELQPYIRTQTEALKYRTGSKGKSADYITREGVFRHMWMDIKLTDLHKCYIYSHFPNLWELYACIREFRNVFNANSARTVRLF